MAWNQLKDSGALTLILKVVKLHRNLAELKVKQQTVRALRQMRQLAGKKTDALGKKAIK